MSTWSIAMPLFSSPDEPAHVIKAAAVARGHLSGRDEITAAGDTLTHVRVPAPLVSTTPCFAHKPKVTAACQKFHKQSTGLVDATTLAGHYPPLYYAIVGVGSDVIPGHRGLYLMRIFSSLLSAAFLASALLSVRRWPSGFGTAGLAAAVSPMVIFLGAGVNPSGLEITAAIGVWTALLTLLGDPVHSSTRLVVRLGLAASFLTLTRALSPLWLAVILVVCCIPTGLRVLRAAASRRDIQICAAVVFVATLCAVGWVKFAGALTLRPNRGRVALPFADAFSGSLQRMPFRLEQMVGDFGWLDTTPSLWTQVVWVGVPAALVLLCLSTRGPRIWVTLVLVAVLSTLLPSIIEASQEKNVGFVWQGRYSMPLAVGVPLVAARFVQLGVGQVAWQTVRRLVAMMVGLLMSGQVVAFVWNERRYTVGSTRRLGLSGDLSWSPPLLSVQLFALLALASAVVLGSQMRAGVPGGEDVAVGPEDRQKVPSTG